MKDSANNTFKDILHNDIITKTKSTLNDFVSGVKNLFRHTAGNPEEDDKAPAKSINNHLKSPEEIEAEFRFLSASQVEDSNKKPLETPSVTYTTIISRSEIDVETHLEEALPDYMEENY